MRQRSRYSETVDDTVNLVSGHLHGLRLTKVGLFTAVAVCVLSCVYALPAAATSTLSADTLQEIEVDEKLTQKETPEKKQEDIVADTNTDGRNSSYSAIFFIRFAPQNALDMIRRVPGFNLQSGRSARGFGGTAGNVLLDGARPTSKNNLEDVLKRIPATQVEKIEVLRGGVGASNAAGQSVVANIVRIAGASTGTATYSLERGADGTVRPRLELTYSTTLDGWETSSRLSTGAFSNPRSAVFQDFDTEGNLTSSTTENRANKGEWAWYTGEAGKNLFGGRLIINTRFGGGRPGHLITREIFDNRLPDSRPDEFTVINQPNTDHAFELGANWTKTSAKNWQLSLIGLTEFESRSNPSLLTDENNQGVRTFLSDSQAETDTIESILRTTYGKVGSSKLKPEFGAEIAYNQLISTLDLFEEDEDGIVDIEVPSANAKVAEIRTEAFTNLVWQAGDKLTIDGGLTWEISRLRVTGDANSTQTFKFFKPTLTATYNFSDSLQLQVKGERQIGQLDFNDFAASNDVGVDRVLAGNPELRPDKTWRASTRLDWRFSKRGSINVRAFVIRRTDVLEQIVLPSGGSGRGNAGSANFTGIDVEAVLPLGFLLPGAQIEADYRRRFTSFFDEIIQEDRNISNRNRRKLNFRFRQDITEHQVAWGVNLEGRFSEPKFFVDEVNFFRGNDRYTAFIETTRYFGLKMRLEFENFNGARFESDRFFFSPTRAGVPDGSQQRRFKPGSAIQLQITSQF